ncbi:hypothetical protein I2I11_04300 [Pontibacter sp. 172403-2]|uniref:DUF6157 family protein n=1 Tax=Pontibacter rufus TaxID=2791028 RepID=UPI0018B0138F|nr:DUF6157 family protein [Pontibacter sp. 172403-2]MBF9252506.1 hypothetical protein [Pontibacter sp. 172403-2]
MSYINTLIRVSDDCPVQVSEIPVAKNNKKPAHLIQYELLTSNPYRFGHEELIYEVFVRQKEIPAAVLETDAAKIKDELFSKGHPCMRASALVKKYGFGAHYNEEGKIAIYPVESKAYQSFMEDKDIKVIAGMRTKKV